MENKSNDIKKLLQFLFTMYAGKIRSGSGTDLNDNYAWLLATLANQEKASQEKLEERIQDEKTKDYDKIREIIGNFHQLMSRPDIVKELRESNIRDEDFARKYKEEIFGEPTREYDMSYLKRDSIISEDGNEHKKEYITPNDKPQEIEYTDSKGKTIKIANIGELHYVEWTGIKDEMSMYRVKKENDNGEFSEHYVYSNIIVSNMDEPEYRKAVLDELLSDKNISLSNAGGYIGEISYTPHKEGATVQLYTEDKKPDIYTYRVSPRYALTYTSERVSAAISEPAKDISTKNKSKTVQTRNNVIPFGKASGAER